MGGGGGGVQAGIERDCEQAVTMKNTSLFQIFNHYGKNVQFQITNIVPFSLSRPSR